MDPAASKLMTKSRKCTFMNSRRKLKALDEVDSDISGIGLPRSSNWPIVSNHTSLSNRYTFPEL